MNREQIMEIMPHRDAMLLLDEAFSQGEGNACGAYTVRGDEWFLRGHFPGNPVVPGVILCEIMAQTACALLSDQMKGKTPYYAGIDGAKFRRMVRPGETIETSVQLKRQKLNVYVIAGEARVDGQMAASGILTFIIS